MILLLWTTGHPLKPEANGMEYDHDKIDEMTLALLWLTSFKD